MSGIPENEGLERWLAREVPEPVLEPELPIIDAHHHLWDHRAQPKLAARWRQRVYLLPEILADVRQSGHNIVQTVYVQAGSFLGSDGPSELKPLGEVEFAQGVAAMADSGLYGPQRVCGGIVGTVDLESPNAEHVLRTMQAASRNFRGVRTPLHSSSEFVRGFAALSKLGLSFDIWQRPYQNIRKVTALATAFPDVTIILNHLGGLVGPNMKGNDFDQWKLDLKEISQRPNVVCKVGGIQMETNGWGFGERQTPIGSEELCQLVLPYYSHAIDCFGTSRCMFESNFPVEKDSVSYRALWNVFKRVAAKKSLTPAQKADIFYGTAARVYRLELPAGAPERMARSRAASRL